MVVSNSIFGERVIPIDDWLDNGNSETFQSKTKSLMKDNRLNHLKVISDNDKIFGYLVICNDKVKLLSHHIEVSK